MPKLLIKAILNFLFVLTISGNVILYNSFEESLLAKAVVASINNFFMNRKGFVTFAWSSVNSDGERYQKDFVDEVMPQLSDDIPFTVESQNTSLIWYTNNLIVFFTDTDERLSFIKNRSEGRSLRRKEFYYIVYTGSLDEYKTKIQKIFEKLWHLSIIDVNILIWRGDQIEVLTYFPFAPGRCRTVTPTVQYVFDNKISLVEENLFPVKTGNLYNCPIWVATWDLPPFVSLTKTDAGRYTLNGIEGYLLLLLSKRLNFTIEILVPHNKRGVLYENGTATGALEMVLSGGADLTINSYTFSAHRNEYLTPSHYYAYYPVVIAVPPGKELTPFERLMKPFNFEVWLYVGVSILLSFGCILVIKHINNNKIRELILSGNNWDHLFGILSVFLTGAVFRTPVRNFARYFLMLWILYALILRSVYQGSLYPILMDSGRRQDLKTIKQIVKENFDFFAEKNLVDIADSSGTLRGHVQYYKAEFDECIKMLRNSSTKVAVILMQPRLDYIRKKDRKNNRIAMLPERFLLAPVLMYFKRKSFLDWKVNKETYRYNQVGLMQFWATKTKSVDKFDYEKTQPLCIAHLNGIFVVFIILMLASIGVFILELLLVKFKLT